MHLVRLDIDKKNAASQYHVGPLGAGLNAIYSPLVANSTLLTRFTKSLLFRGQTLGEFADLGGCFRAFAHARLCRWQAIAGPTHSCS